MPLIHKHKHRSKIRCTKCGHRLRLSDKISRDGDRGFAHDVCTSSSLLPPQATRTDDQRTPPLRPAPAALPTQGRPRHAESDYSSSS